MKLRITVEGKPYEVEVEMLGRDGMSPAHAPAPTHAGIPSRAPVATAPAAPAKPAAGGANAVKAQIAGTIMHVKVEPGQKVEVGDALLVVEAMKMETTIASKVAGTIKAVLVAPGDAVKVGQALVEFE